MERVYLQKEEGLENDRNKVLKHSGTKKWVRVMEGWCCGVLRVMQMVHYLKVDND